MEFHNIDVDLEVDFGIILEKNYSIYLLYDHLCNNEEFYDIILSFHPKWGEDFLYFKYKEHQFFAISAKGASVAVNAVERVRRAKGKAIIFIGTCGSTDESISDGSFVVPISAVRDEGVTSGYLGINAPALADIDFSYLLKSELSLLADEVRMGVAYTTDKRYKEDPELLRHLRKTLNVCCIDMETSAVLLVATYYGIKVAEIRVVTDCAVKETEGNLKGVFDVEKHHDFLSFVNPKLILAFTAAVKACIKQFDTKCCHAKH